LKVASVSDVFFHVYKKKIQLLLFEIAWMLENLSLPVFYMVKFIVLCILLRARAQQHQLRATWFIRQKHISILTITRIWSWQVANELWCAWYV